MAALTLTISTPVLVLFFDCWKWLGAKDAISQPPVAGLTLPVTPVRENLQMVAAQDRAGGGQSDNSDPDGPALETCTLLEIPVDVSEVVIPDFRPRSDRCRVRLRYPDIKFDHWVSAAGAVLAFQDGPERLTITFQGLNHPPFEDIETVFECPDSGLQTRPLAGVSGKAQANELAEEINDAEWRIAAWAETERAVEAYIDAYPGSAGDDYCLMLPKFAEFDANSERIEIWVPSDCEAKVPVEILPTHDGLHGLVLVAGRPAALLQGAPTASVRNFQLVPMAKKAA